MAPRKGRIVSFYCDAQELEQIPRGKRSKVISEAIRLFLAPDGKAVQVEAKRLNAYITREKAIRLAKKRLGLNGHM